MAHLTIELLIMIYCYCTAIQRYNLIRTSLGLDIRHFWSADSTFLGAVRTTRSREQRHKRIATALAVPLQTSLGANICMTHDSLTMIKGLITSHCMMSFCLILLATKKQSKVSSRRSERENNVKNNGCHLTPPLNKWNMKRIICC